MEMCLHERLKHIHMWIEFAQKLIAHNDLLKIINYSCGIIVRFIFSAVCLDAFYIVRLAFLFPCRSVQIWMKSRTGTTKFDCSSDFWAIFYVHRNRYLIAVYGHFSVN